MLTVPCRKSHDELVDALKSQCSEAEADLKTELLRRCVCDHCMSGDEDDGESQTGDNEEDLEEGVDGEYEPRQTLEEGHLANNLAAEEEVELLCSLQSAKRPARALLEMRREILRHSSPLERLVDVSSPPAAAEQHGRCADILGKRSSRPATNALKSTNADSVA